MRERLLFIYLPEGRQKVVMTPQHKTPRDVICPATAHKIDLGLYELRDGTDKPLDLDHGMPADTGELTVRAVKPPAPWAVEWPQWSSYGVIVLAEEGETAFAGRIIQTFCANGIVAAGFCDLERAIEAIQKNEGALHARPVKGVFVTAALREAIKEFPRGVGLLQGTIGGGISDESSDDLWVPRLEKSPEKVCQRILWEMTYKMAVQPEHHDVVNAREELRAAGLTRLPGVSEDITGVWWDLAPVVLQSHRLDRLALRAALTAAAVSRQTLRPLRQAVDSVTDTGSTAIAVALPPAIDIIESNTGAAA